MFTVSRQVDYAIQLVHRLAQLNENETLSLRVFSEESNISFLFLQKIARSLKLQGLVDSTKGARGGYKLGRLADQISVKDIIDAVEGPYAVVECAKVDHGCTKVTTCKTKDMWQEINKDITAKLETMSVLEFS